MARRAEIKKEKKENADRQISRFRFAAGLVTVVLLFFVLFSVIGFLADAVKYSVEGDETISRLEQSIAESEETAKQIGDGYEAETLKKVAFSTYLYEYDRDLIGGEAPVLLPTRPVAFFDETGEVIVKEENFPSIARTRILNYIQEANLGADTSDYVTTDESARIRFSQLKTGEFVAVIDDLSTQEYLESNISDAKTLVEAVSSRHSFVIAEKDGMYYAGPPSLDIPEGTPIGNVMNLLDESGDKLNEWGFISRVNSKLYFTLISKQNSVSDMTLYYLLDLGYIFRQSMMTIIATFAAMICSLIVLLYYLIQYREQQRFENTPPAERGFRSKRRILLILGTVLTALVAYYTRTVFCVSSYVMDDKAEIASLRTAIEESEKSADRVIYSFHDSYDEEIMMVSRYLAAKPERRTRETLHDLSEIFGFNYLVLFDADGREVISDSDFVDLELSSNKEDLSYNVRKVLNGGYQTTFTGLNDMTGEYQVLACNALYDAQDMPFAVIVAAISTEQETGIRTGSSVFSVMDRRMAGGQTKFFLVDPEGQFFYHTPFSQLDGLNPADYGFTETVLKEGFSGRVNLEGVPYFMTQDVLDNVFVYTAIPFSVVYGTRTPFTIAAAITALLILLYAARRCQKLKIMRVSGGKQPAAEIPEAEGEGITREVLPPTARSGLPNSGLPASAEEKTTKLILRICQIVGVLIAVVLIFRDRLVPENSMIHYVLTGGWERGLNVYAVTAVLILILTVVIGTSFVLYVLNVLSRILSPRGETVCRLLRSAVEYFSVIMTAYVGFSYFGARVETLITTASLMVLLVGMGAQDLTADIIAGLFLMFESEFQVGDVIDTGGKIGIVREIGLHSTKLVDFNNNVLIISNSKLADIVNRTQRNSFAFTDFKVSTAVKISELEELFRQELPALKVKYPKFVGEPYFRGVSQFNGSTMVCGIAAEVTEKDRVAMERILNREVLRILKKAEITPL